MVLKGSCNIRKDLGRPQVRHALQPFELFLLALISAFVYFHKDCYLVTFFLPRSLPQNKRKNTSNNRINLNSILQLPRGLTESHYKS